MADIFEIAGRIHSTSQEGVATVADEILDETKGKKQSQVNAETDATLAEHTSIINGLNSQNYVTVTATDQTTDVTDVLPATGETDTVYRVGNWDGSQFDASAYSEYAWNGSSYVHLNTKTQVGEVFDISAYHATGGVLAKYVDLAAALDSNNGGGVPQSLQKGGMSIRFVKSSYNMYVQCRYMSSSTAVADFTNTANWQGVDDTPTYNSKNLVESGGVASKTSIIDDKINSFDVTYYGLGGYSYTYSKPEDKLYAGRKYRITINGITDSLRIINSQGETITFPSGDNTTEVIFIHDINSFNFFGPTTSYVRIEALDNIIPATSFVNNTEKVDNVAFVPFVKEIYISNFSDYSNVRLMCRTTGSIALFGTINRTETQIVDELNLIDYNNKIVALGTIGYGIFDVDYIPKQNPGSTVSCNILDSTLEKNPRIKEYLDKIELQNSITVEKTALENTINSNKNEQTVINNVLNQNVISIDGNDTELTERDVTLYAGRRYRIVATNTTQYIQFKYSGGTIYMSEFTFNEEFCFPYDITKIASIKGVNSNVTITPLDMALSPDVYSVRNRHTADMALDAGVEEIYVPQGIASQYDSIKFAFYNYTSKLIKIIGVSGGTSTDITDFVNINSVEDNIVTKVNDNCYIILNKTYIPKYVTYEFVLTNTTLDKNPRIKEYLDKIELQNAISNIQGLTALAGTNILETYERYKGISSSGSIMTNTTSWGNYYVTEKLYFGEHGSIICSNCAIAVSGLYAYTYASDDTPVRKIDPTNTITKVTKESGEAYVRFTLINDGSYKFIPMAQYDYETPYEPYSKVGGYLPQKIFYCGPNRQYTTLKSAIEAATSVMDGVLYVDDGVYDLVQEFGDDYFNSLTSSSNLAGIKLMNRVHIIFSPNSIVKCHYQGDAHYAQSHFSPFNAGEYGFTLENLNLEASRVRYAVHDEYAGKSQLSVSRYINCNFKFDNSENDYWNSETIIGGGLGVATEIDIQGCTFNEVNGGNAIYYHQAASAAEYSSKINIKNNYMENGIIMLDFTREYQQCPSIIQISGNSMPHSTEASADGIKRNGSAFTYNIVHVWNNEIRS